MNDYPLRMALIRALKYVRHTNERGEIVPALSDAEADKLINALKSRDPKEPGRERKLKAEKRMAKFWRKVWEKQKAVVTNRASSLKKLSDYDFIFDAGFELDDDEFAELVVMLTDFIKDGVKVFGEGQSFDIDYTLVNAKAAETARKAALDLIKNIDTTTKDSIRVLLESFVNTPGMTLGDIVNQLPFDEERAWNIAVTEVTRTYAGAAIDAGHELAEQFPDIPVVKEWFTNNDDRVCEICGPFNQTTIPLDDQFEDDAGELYDAPPAHPNCRCWLSTHTDIRSA